MQHWTMGIIANYRVREREGVIRGRGGMQVAEHGRVQEAVVALARESHSDRVMKK